MTGIMLASLGAAIAAVLAGIGSSYGVARAGQTGAGLAAEDSNQFGNVLLLSALPSTQAVYGLLAAFLILLNVGLLGGGASEVTVETGWVYAFASLPIGFTALFSGLLQGKVLSSGIQMIAKDSSRVGQVIVLSVLVETFAVFGLLISLLMINGAA